MNNDLQTLYSMLSFKRPAGGPTEGEYINRFLRPLGVKDDKFGNLHLTVGSEKPTTLWSSHTDSVHRSEGHQKITMEGQFIQLHKNSKSGCLGADDAAGNWIMIEMIKAGVPGLYIFHFGEERGGQGSRALLDKTPEVLDGIKAAIAFDRRGTTSVITHQGSRTCSDAFGRSLADQLPGYNIDSGGTFTDTKVYMDLVPECSNVSVGYYQEHTSAERLDVAHLISLRDAMVKIDPSRFVIERDPKTCRDGPSLSSLGIWPRKQKYRSLFSDEPLTLPALLEAYPTTCAEIMIEHGWRFDDLEPLVRKRRAEKAQRAMNEPDWLDHLENQTTAAGDFKLRKSA
jgi:hypothetical protein